MMAKPRPDSYPTLGSFLWARHNWRRRTGGNLFFTFLLGALIGGLTGNAVSFLVIVFGGLAMHLWLRRRAA